MATCYIVNAQVETDGNCPTFTVKTPFDRTKYTGRWFEHSKNPTIFEKGGTCNIANYEDLTGSDGKVVIGVLNQRIDGSNGLVNARGNATLGEPNNASNPGKLIVNFYDPKSSRVATKTNYNILDTDYTTYTIVYACSSRNAGKKSEFLWILTRQQNPPNTVIQTALQKIQSMGIETRNMETVNQTDCPTLPNSSTMPVVPPVSGLQPAQVFYSQRPVQHVGVGSPYYYSYQPRYYYAYKPEYQGLRPFYY